MRESGGSEVGAAERSSRREDSSAEYLISTKQHSLSSKLLIIGLWQVAAFLNVVPSVLSKLLINRQVMAPNYQALMPYILLMIFFGSYLVYRRISGVYRPSAIPWYWFVVAAIVDLEANFCLFKAFQFTSVLSVQLLDCVSVPACLVLSFAFLKVRYRWFNYAASVVCLIGLTILVLSDVYFHDGSTKAGTQGTAYIGDMLALAGGCLYGVSNTIVEYLTKKHKDTDAIYEILTGLGLFGGIFATLQGSALGEYHSLQEASASSGFIASMFVGLAFAFLGIYVISTSLLQHSSAAVMNLSFLSCDFWALLASYVIFNDKLHSLYFLGFFIVLSGVVLFYLPMYCNKSGTAKTSIVTYDKLESDSVSEPVKSAAP